MTKKIKPLEEYQNIIWDFNGTIINDGQLNLKLTNIIRKKREMPLLSYDEYKEKICFPITRFYKKIGLPSEGAEYDQIVTEWTDHYQSEFLKCPLQNYVLDKIKLFQAQQKKQYLLSALHQELLDKAVAHFKLGQYFTWVQGVQKYDGPTKTEEGKWLMERFKIENHKTIMIGDTLHDYEVANHLGIDSLLLAHGHQDAQVLRASGAYVLPSLAPSAGSNREE